MSIRVLLPITVFCFVAAASPQASGAETALDFLGAAKWAFYPGYEFPGAKGNRRTETVDGREALVVNYDFTGGGAYVLAGIPADIPEGPSELRFDVRAEKDLKVVVRLEDSEKQTHQYNLRFESPGQWQTQTINLKEPPPKSFGGPADKTIHYPITKFWVGIGKGSTTAEPGEAAFSMFRTAE